MKFVKKHTNAVVGLGVIILVIIAILIVKKELFFSESTAIYGNRLEGREKVTISNDTKNQVMNILGDSVTNTQMRIAGRLIYITIKVNGETSLEDAKNLGAKTLEPFSDAEKQYYDIQVLIENDVNTSQFPIIGYKHHTKTSLVWTKDRSES